jgi:hypothetical protein
MLLLHPSYSMLSFYLTMLLLPLLLYVRYVLSHISPLSPFLSPKMQKEKLPHSYSNSRPFHLT